MTPWKAIEAAQSVAPMQGKNRIESIRIYEDYAECEGYSAEHGVVVGNWNDISEYRNGKHVVLDKTLSRLGDVLEKMGVELDWDNCVSACGDCGLLVRTQADSYCWQPSFVVFDGELTCLDCLDEEAHLESLEGNPGTLNQIAGVDPEDCDYLLVQGEFQHGFHRGMDADPKRIAGLLEGVGCTRYVFNQDEQSQFYITFSVWLHKEQEHLLKYAQEAVWQGKTDGPSVAAAMERGLQEASRQSDELRQQREDQGGIIVSTVSPDGVETRLVSEQDFVEGKAGRK